MTVAFETECKERVAQLKVAFVELFDSAGADPQSPQDVSRKFKVNKTLAWNVARLLQSSDALQAVNHIPGASSLEKVIQATARHGAAPQIVENARVAVEQFRKMIASHAGDRSTLDLIVDSSGGPDSGGLELSRKLAFRGNSGLYGVQAGTRFKCAMMAPNRDDPSLLDMAEIVGYVDFRRLRPTVRWPIFMVRTWSERQDPLVKPNWEALELGAEGSSDSHVMHAHSRGPLPEITPVATPEGIDYLLGAGPVGNDGAFDCFRGELMRAAAGRYRQGTEDIGEFGAAITAPSEHLVFDLIVHKDLAFALRPEVLVFGKLPEQGRRAGNVDDPNLLPIHPSTAELTGSPPAVNSPLVPRYPQMLRTAFQRMGWDASDFRGVRLTMKYPPFGGSVVLRFPLPPAPAP